MRAGVTIFYPENLRDRQRRRSRRRHGDRALRADSRQQPRLVSDCRIRSYSRDREFGNRRRGAWSGPACILDDSESRRRHLGPYSHLRPGSDIGEGAHVGNFVETKKIKLGKGSKANHLTYLGDAEIGAGVNIGAGTITCNYDGVNKHRR